MLKYFSDAHLCAPATTVYLSDLVQLYSNFYLTLDSDNRTALVGARVGI